MKERVKRNRKWLDGYFSRQEEKKYCRVKKRNKKIKIEDFKEEYLLFRAVYPQYTESKKINKNKRRQI